MVLLMPIFGLKKSEPQAHALEINAVLRVILSIFQDLIFLFKFDIIVFFNELK